MVYAPIEGCPCAYVPFLTFGDFLNHVLKGDPDYIDNMRRIGELETYLAKCNEDAFPKLVRDADLLSFSNGVLVLSEARFVAYPAAAEPGANEDVDADDVAIVPASPTDGLAELAEELRDRVARHHIDAPFVGSVDTPLFDRVVLSQLSPEVAHTLLLLMGRLLFAVGARDNWQVMPFIIGAGGTGKSILLDVVAAQFAPSAVGSLSSNQEQTFGLDGKVDCDLIIGRDLPHKMSAVLSQEVFQSMVTGEKVPVPRKGAVALDVQWRVPLIFASNHMPDYADNAGQVARRVVPIFFKKPVAEKDPTLLRRIKAQEMPAVVLRSLRAYLAAAAEHGDVDFWKWCPAELRKSQSTMAKATNTMRRFLALGPDDEGHVYFKLNPLAYTTFKGLRDEYKTFVQRLRDDTPGLQMKTHDIMDEDSLRLAGFEVANDIKHCGFCGNKVLLPDVCCDKKSDKKRTSVPGVKGLIMVRRPATVDQLDE
jgi:hypothetical protein